MTTEIRLDHEALRKKYEVMRPVSTTAQASGAIWNAPQTVTLTLSYCQCGIAKWADSVYCERCIILTLLSEANKLRAFKQYVHDRLDAAGINKHQEQNAINGCRIGSRLDDVL